MSEFGNPGKALIVHFLCDLHKKKSGGKSYGIVWRDPGVNDEIIYKK